MKYQANSAIAQAVYVLTYPMLRLMNPKAPEKQLNGEFHIAVQGFLNGYSAENVDWLLRQARYEAGPDWGNLATKQDNNPFGMGKVYKRPTTQTGSRLAKDGSQGKNTIGLYTSIRSAVCDRFMWDAYNKVSPKSVQYVDAVLAGGYNSNTEYSFDWQKDVYKSGVLTIRKIHLAMLSMLVLGFLGFQLLAKGLKK